MALVPVTETPGLWRDSDWQPNMPGVYAIIVGSSNYPHLRGGADPASDTFGLSQLYVSATTAVEVFKWLRDDFRRDGMPVVWCCLLLSPGMNESLDDEIVRHAERATYPNLQRAIQRWSGILPQTLEAARKSRSFFFFSGHGIQSNWKSLLLPADYLDPSFGTPQLQNCFSTGEIKQWMETHPVAEHFAIFDACRNEFSPLATRGATANTVLLPAPAAGPPPDVVATFAATAPGDTAFQSSKLDLSFFGKALLEGLKGASSIAMGGAADSLAIEFNQLVSYVTPRINVLLKEHNHQLEQTARHSLESSKTSFIVTQLLNRAPATETDIVRRAQMAQRALDEEFIERERVMTTQKSGSSRTLVAQFNRIMGCLEGLKLFDLQTGSPQSDDGLEVISTAGGASGEMVRVDFALPEGRNGILLVFESSVTRNPGGIILPLPTEPGYGWDRGGTIRLTLTVAFDSHRGLILEKVEARLGPSKQSAYDYLWRLETLANFGSFAHAAEHADPDRLRLIVGEKLEHFVAALAAGTILARGGQIGKIKHWTRNLMDWFPQTPDGAVLWAESVRAATNLGEGQPFGVIDPLDAIADAVGELAARGVPYFAETVELADELVRYLLRHSGSLSAERVKKLDHVKTMLEGVFRFARPSGQFLMLTAPPNLDHSNAEFARRFLRPQQTHVRKLL